MNYTELKNAMSNYNKNHKPRFNIGADGKTLMIGAYNNPFNFTENDYKEVEYFINQYGMLKEDKDCLGDELWYKGLDWNDLTETQKQSVLKCYDLDSDSECYRYLFNNNKSFLTY